MPGTARERSCEGSVEKVHDIEAFMRVNSRKQHLFCLAQETH